MDVQIIEESVPVNMSADRPETDPYHVGSYIAAEYNRKWFIGKILEFDSDDMEYSISFMEAGSSRIGHTFKWPRQDDVIWVPNASVLCSVIDPISYRKRKKFKLSDEEIERVVHCLKNNFELGYK